MTTGHSNLLTHAEEIALAKCIQAASTAREKLAAGRMTAAKAAPILAAGTNAREVMILRNEGLVIKMANHYRNQGVELDDLIQEGYIGLMRAVDKFDWRRGMRFSTMATWWIRQAISRAVASDGQTIRVPQHVYDLRWKCARASQLLDQRLGRAPTTAEIAREVGISEKRCHFALLTYRQPASLDEPMGGSYSDDRELGDVVAAPETPIEEQVAEALDAEVLREAVADMEFPEDAAVIRRSYGLIGDPMTDNEIGKLTGVTRSRIHQRRQRGLRMLKHALEHTEAPRERGRT